MDEHIMNTDVENKKQQDIEALFLDLLPKETVRQTSIKGLSLFRIDASFSRIPYAYNSQIIIMGQGIKNTYCGDEVFTYDPSHYLVLPVPLPLECDGRTVDDKPILGVTIDIDPLEIGDILREMDVDLNENKTLHKGIYGAPMSESLYDATIRLLQSFKRPNDEKILAPMARKEIIYRILQGKNGEMLGALAQNNKKFYQISKVLEKIHGAFNQPFDIDNLALELDMSNSTFHNSFKSVTGTSPLQYIKNVRLHKARTFMIQDGLNASTASYEVGYESPSQFNREYKRLFGITPAKDVALMR